MAAAQEKQAAATAAAAAAKRAPAAPRERQNVSITLGDEIAADVTSGMLNHFGYCEDAQVTGKKIALTGCVVPRDGKLPLTIRGFKLLMVGNNDTINAQRLDVEPFDVVMPPAWNAEKAVVQHVLGGRLNEVLNRPIRLEQGTPGCEIAAFKLTAKAVLTRVVAWPDPPCKPFQVELPANLVQGRAAPVITAGCSPRGERVTVNQGRAQCWRVQTSTQTTPLKIDWGPGFSEYTRDITQQDVVDGVTITAQEVLDALVPAWPYQGRRSPLAASDQTPVYAPTKVQYLTDGGAADCTSPVTLDGTAQNVVLPSLATAGCRTRLPTRARVSYALDEGRMPAGLQVAAFKREIASEFTIGQQVAAMALNDAKVSLPVRFTATDGERFRAKFGSGVNNTINAAEIFQAPGCERRGAPNRVSFLPGSGQAPVTALWPLYGQVFDGRDNLANTDCAAATIAVDNAGPYLTFAFKDARAIGKRRIILIASGPEVSSGIGKSALSAALSQLVDKARALDQSDVPLSPVNVYTVTGDLRFRPLFRGEDAARNSEQVKAKIGGELGGDGPPIPPLDQLSTLQDLKPDDFDRIVIIMEGSQPDQQTMGALALISGRIAQERTGRPESVTLVLTSPSCDAWRQIANKKCEQISQSVGQYRDGKAREQALANIFLALLNSADGQRQDGGTGGGAAPVPPPPTSVTPKVTPTPTPTPKPPKKPTGG